MNVDPPPDDEPNDGEADDPAEFVASATKKADVPAADDPVGTPTDVPAEESGPAPKAEPRRGARTRRPPQKYPNQDYLTPSIKK